MSQHGLHTTLHVYHKNIKLLTGAVTKLAHSHATKNFTLKISLARKKLPKQAGLVHDIKSVKTVVPLLCMPYQKRNAQ